MHCFRDKGVIPFVALLVFLFVTLPANLPASELDSLEFGEFEHVLVHESNAFLTTGKGLLVALDITDPTSPLLQDTLLLPKNPSDMMIVHDTDYLITVEDDSGLCVVDISDLSNLTLAYINRDYQADLVAQETPAPETTRLYLSESANIWVVDFLGPDSFTEIATYTHDGLIKGMEAREYSLYVSCRMDGLSILDMWNSASPIVVGHYNGWVNDLSLPADPEATYLLTLRSQTETGGMGIVDIADPSSPVMTGEYEQYGGYGTIMTFHAVAQWDNEFAILPITWEPEQEDVSYTLYIVDFLDHTTPWPIWYQELDKQARDVAMSEDNDFVFVATTVECLVYDVSSPSSTALIAVFPGHDTVNETGAAQPESFNLDGIYPNPFNPMSTINFSLDRPQHIQLAVFDICGRMVQKLSHGTFSQGAHQCVLDGAQLASGTYLVQLKGESGTETRQVILLK